MHRIAKLLVLIGALCFLVAGVSIGFALAAPTGARAAPALTLGTATPPPQPTDEPAQVPPTATPPPTIQPTTRTSSQPLPTATPRPQRNPTATPEPIAPPSSTATPEPWTTEVEIVKQANQTVVLPGDTFAYTLVARNLGSQTAVDVIVRDSVPEQLDVIDLDSTKGDITVSGQTVTAYPRALEAGESATYRITVRVRANAQPGQFPNTGIITTTTPGDTPGNNTSTVTIEIRRVQRVAQILPPRMPHTAEGDTTIFAAVPPIVWAALVAGLIFLLGGALVWGGGTRRAAPAAAGRGSALVLAVAGTLAASYRIPASAPAGPPRLGTALPPAQPPAPLPPLVALDRADALRDAERGGSVI